MEKTNITPNGANEGNEVSALFTNKIFYLNLVGRVVDGVNGLSEVKTAHFAKISLGECIFHNENFAQWCGREFTKRYGEGECDVMCSEDWDEVEGDISRTFTTLSWRDEQGELLARVFVTGEQMRECDCKFVPNHIVHP